MGQNFSLLEYGNYQDPCANANAVLSKSQFWEKNLVLPIDKFQFLVLARNTIML